MPQSPRKPNDFLRCAREERGWSQSDAAAELEVSLDTIQGWERGRRSPGPRQQAKLCKVYHMTPEQLRLQLKLARQVGSLPSQDAFALVPTPPLAPKDALVEVSKQENVPEEASPHGEATLSPVEPFLPHQGMDAYRRRMLRRVQSLWVEGVLKDSLHQAVLIPLHLMELPEALANPWHHVVQETDGMAHALPPGTSITHMYDLADGKLLILGEPGAGKTTLLLELTRELLSRAEKDERHLIPAVFHLSTWAVKQSSLTEWLVEELQSKYDVPEAVAQTWVETDQLVVLLNGLDEVSEATRPACVKRIGTYQQEHKLAPLVMCCRKSDYFEQTTRMAFLRAVHIQPLTREQMNDYLSYADGQLEAVQTALREDPELEEMVQTPLMLRIVSQTYQGHSSIILAGSKEERRQQIFPLYIERMLARRGVGRYHTPQTIHWLSWLGNQMDRHSQTVFYLERVQPDWLTDDRSLRQYRLMLNRIIVGISVLIFSGLLACFRGDFIPNDPGLFFWLGGGRGDRVLGWMAPGMGGGMPGATSLSLLFALVAILVQLLGDRRRTPAFTMKALQRAFLAGLRWGLLIGGIIGVVSGIFFSREAGFTCLGGSLAGVACGGSVGLFGGIIVGFQIALIALLRFDARPFSKGEKKKTIFSRKDRFLNALIFGFCGFLGFISIYSWQAGGINQLGVGYGLISGVYFGLVYHQGFEIGVVPELGVTIQLAETAVWSWQKVSFHFGDNLKKGASLAGILLVCVVSIITCISSLFYGVNYGIRYGLIYGVMVAMISGVTGCFMGVLISGWSNDMLDERQFARPNEGIRRSRRNALFAACLFGPIGGVTSGLVSALAFALGGISGWPILGSGLACIFTLTSSYQIFMLCGGTALLEHYTLRWSLWRKGVMPWNYIAFCNYAVERVFLRKWGGGYMFIHPLLKEHFTDYEDH